MLIILQVGCRTVNEVVPGSLIWPFTHLQALDKLDLNGLGSDMTFQTQIQ